MDLLWVVVACTPTEHWPARLAVRGVDCGQSRPGQDQPGGPNTRLAQLLSSETASILGQQIRQITAGAGGALGLATVLGIATALWSASSGMKALITGVNLAYDQTETCNYLKLRGPAFVLTVP